MVDENFPTISSGFQKISTDNLSQEFFKTWKDIKNLMGSDGYPLQTQKAKGFMGLLKHNSQVGSRFYDTQIYPHTDVDFSKPKFCRPCPFVPRHGFVDSTVIENQNQFKKLVEATKEASGGDPFEILVMDYVDTEHNAIVTPNGLTIGDGHDGATSGKNVLSFPFETETRHLLREFGVNKETGFVENTPFVEMVYEKGNGFIPVQVRDGPKIELTKNHIPKNVVVKEIIRTDDYGDNLLKWEKDINNAEKGTVVLHPGGALHTHFSVHAVQNGLPVITDTELCEQIEIGTNLEKNSSSKKVNNKVFRKALVSCLKPGSLTENDWRTHGEMAISSIHCSSYWDDSPHLNKVLGFSISNIYRLGAVACIGENRYTNVKSYGVVNHFELGGLSRHQVYRHYLKEDIYKLQELVYLCHKNFSERQWKGSYGGPKWAECSKLTLELGNLILDYLDTGDEELVRKMVTTCNKIVNASHNTNKFLSKFVDGKFFDRVNRFPAKGLLRVETLKLCQESFNEPEEVFNEEKYQGLKNFFDNYSPNSSIEKSNMMMFFEPIDF